MNSNKNFTAQLSTFAAFAVVGYTLWKSRYKIQEMLESVGIETPWMRDSFGEAVSSGVAKLKGSAKADLNGVNTSSAI